MEQAFMTRRHASGIVLLALAGLVLWGWSVAVPGPFVSNVAQAAVVIFNSVGGLAL